MLVTRGEGSARFLVGRSWLIFTAKFANTVIYSAIPAKLRLQLPGSRYCTCSLVGCDIGSVIQCAERDIIDMRRCVFDPFGTFSLVRGYL
jgi:hypothetical protein